jgi:hypothetical protein
VTACTHMSFSRSGNTPGRPNNMPAQPNLALWELHELLSEKAHHQNHPDGHPPKRQHQEEQVTEMFALQDSVNHHANHQSPLPPRGGHLVVGQALAKIRMH